MYRYLINSENKTKRLLFDYTRNSSSSSLFPSLHRIPWYLQQPINSKNKSDVFCRETDSSQNNDKSD